MNAPLRFCASPRCSVRVPSGYCPEHRQQATAFHRPQGAHGQGYTRQWERFRTQTFPALLVEAGIVPCCGARLASGPSPHSKCQQQGLFTVYGLELDHDPPLQDWERAQPELVCDPHRVGYLCKADHSAKTRQEQLQPTTHTGSMRYVICGPPGAGKTTWVERRARLGDIVWDLDKVAAVVALAPTFPRPPLVLDALDAMLNGLVQWLADDSRATAYLIIANQDKATRLARQIGAVLVPLTLDHAVAVQSTWHRGV